MCKKVLCVKDSLRESLLCEKFAVCKKMLCVSVKAGCVCKFAVRKSLLCVKGSVCKIFFA